MPLSDVKIPPNADAELSSIIECYQNAVDHTGSYSEDERESCEFCGSEHLSLIDPEKVYFHDPLHGNKDI